MQNNNLQGMNTIQVFQLKTKPDGIYRLDNFLLENFVCIGYPRLGDLTNTDKDTMRNLLVKHYNYEKSLKVHLSTVNSFVNTMNSGDFVLVKEDNFVHVGKVGEYYYDPKYVSEGMCHRRNVVWVAKFKKEDLREDVLAFINNVNTISRFKDIVFDEYDLLENKPNQNIDIETKDELITKSVKILKDALNSPYEEIRVKAACSLLDYLK